MMDLSNLASQSASQTSNASNTPLPGTIMPALPLTDAVTPAFNHAIALQQFQFQQSLMNQQLVAQQQAVAHAVSIKAAAERAAARAAEISMLLSGETKVVEKSEDLVAETEREKSGLEAPSRSASPPQSSKPNTVSPISHRNSHREPEEHSPRDRSAYGSSRNPSAYSRSNDLRGYSRSSYRRGEDYPSRSSYDRSRNTSWSRGRSPLSRSRYRRGDSRSPRRHVGSRSPHRHVGSRSPRRHRIRSPSPISRQQTSTRASNRHGISKSPTKGGSSSTSPPHARKSSPRKATARRSLSSSEDSPIHNTENLLSKENTDADLNAGGQERDAKPLRVNLVSGRSNSNSRKKSVSRSPRRHVRSRSSQRHRIRSPSPILRQQTSTRASNRHGISKSPTKGGSSSTSPPHARKVSPKKATARRSLSSSEDSPIHNTENVLLKENKDTDLNVRGQERDAKPPRGRSNSDHFGEMNSRKKSVSRSPRRHASSRFAHRHRIRSPSPISRQQTSTRASNRHGISKSTTEGGSSSASPPRARKVTPRKAIARRSLSSSQDSPIHNTENLLLKEDKDADLNARGIERDAKPPPRGKIVSGRSNSNHCGEMNYRKKSVSRSPRRHVGSPSSRRHRIRSPSPISRNRTSSRISTRHSISKSPIKGGSNGTSPPRARKASPRKAIATRSLSSSEDSPIHNTENLLLKENKPAVMKSGSRDFCSARMDRSGFDNTQGQSVRKGLGSRDCKNDSETTVPSRSTDQISLPTEMLDRCSHRNDRDTKNRNDDFSMSNGKGKRLHESATVKGIEEGHKKPSRIIKPSSSLQPQGNLSDHGQRNYSDKREEKMHVNKEFDMHEKELSQKVISSNEEDSANIPGEYAIYPLPEGHGSMDVKEVESDGDAKAYGNVSASPKLSKHREKRHKHRSISRDRRTKHRKSHHKKHRDESEEEEGEITDKKRESHEKRKMKRRDKKGRGRYH